MQNEIKNDTLIRKGGTPAIVRSLQVLLRDAEETFPRLEHMLAHPERDVGLEYGRQQYILGARVAFEWFQKELKEQFDIEGPPPKREIETESPGGPVPADEYVQALGNNVQLQHQRHDGQT